MIHAKWVETISKESGERTRKYSRFECVCVCVCVHARFCEHACACARTSICRGCVVWIKWYRRLNQLLYNCSWIFDLILFIRCIGCDVRIEKSIIWNYSSDISLLRLFFIFALSLCISMCFFLLQYFFPFPSYICLWSYYYWIECTPFFINKQCLWQWHWHQCNFVQTWNFI